MYDILQYTPDQERRFDRFVNEESVNGTFLQSRRFLGYHPEGRFQDASFALHKSGIIAAYFPGNVKDNEFISHQGSTFGGPVFSRAFYNGSRVLEVLKEADEYFAQNYKKVRLKLTPAIFSQEPPDLIEYALEHLGYARHTELSSYTPLSAQENPLYLCDAKHRHQFQAAEDFEIEYRDLANDEELATFYKFLEISKAKHNTVPVHSFEELKLLREKKIKKNLRFRSIWWNGRYIAGMMQFLFPQAKAIHDQYISPDESFTDFHHTTQLHILAMREAAKEGFTKFSWGISTEDSGNILNENLFRFKESFGAKPSVNVTYTKQF